jgi:probable HAF family extracellular repeat protein
MRINLTPVLAGFYSLVLGILAVANSLAGGTGGSTITNLPTLGGSGLYVYGLNATGQLTGFSYTSGDSAYHAFLDANGVLADLGTLGGSTSIGYAINNSGWVVGQADLAGYGQTGYGQSHAFIGGAGNLLDLGTLGGSFSIAAAINDAGQIAGSSTLVGDATTVAFLYANGSMTNLGTLGGDFSSARALNNAGAVVGQSYTTNGDLHGFVYAGGTMTDVGTLGGTYSSALALDDAGVVVGESDTTNGDIHGFIYAGGVLTDIGTLGGTYSSAYAINTAGQAIGMATTLNDAEAHAFMYSGGTLADLGTLGGGYSAPNAINNLGAVVGTSATTNGNYHAFLYQMGQMVDLNTLLPTNSGWELTDAYFINDSGRIVGLGTYNGLSQWFIMDVVAANHPPVAVAGPDQTVDCAAQVTLDGSQSSDPDNDPLTFEWSLGGYVLGTNVSLATSLPLGTNVITLKVTDPSGASAQTNLIVRVVDTTPPTVSCPAPTTASSEANCQAPVPNVLARVIASDNCTLAQLLTMSQNPAAGTLVGLGPHPITVTVSDPSGNTATCSTLFTVVDTTPPVIVSIPSPITVSADANCQATVPNVLADVVATDNCTPANQLTLSQSPAAGTFLGTGQHTITVTVTDASGNSSTATVSFTVADTTAPTIISTPAPITVSADANCQGVVPNVLPNVVATDNCTPANQLVLSQSPSAGTVVGPGQSTITLTVTDASGNSSTASVLLTVADTTPPVIQSLTANPSVLSPPNGKLVPVTISVTASDNCDPAPVNKIVSVTCNAPIAAGDIKITGNLTVSLAASKGPAGKTTVYTITVGSTDASGNSSTTNVTVTVPGKK